MTEEAPSKTPQRRLPAVHGQIATKWRWIAAVLGIAGLGAGGAAVFTTDVEAGPVALLVVGLVFMFISMSGRLPSRLRMGDNEAEWLAVQAYVEETVDEASPGEKPLEIMRIAELALNAPQALAPNAASGIMRSAAYEILVHEMLLSIATNAADKIRFVDKVDAAHRDHGFDFVVERMDGSRRVLIEIRRLAPPRIMLRKRLERITLDGDILLVSDAIDVEPFLSLDPRLTAIAVHDRSDSQKLASALAHLLRLPQLGGDVQQRSTATDPTA